MILNNRSIFMTTIFSTLAALAISCGSSDKSKSSTPAPQQLTATQTSEQAQTVKQAEVKQEAKPTEVKPVVKPPVVDDCKVDPKGQHPGQGKDPGQNKDGKISPNQGKGGCNPGQKPDQKPDQKPGQKPDQKPRQCYESNASRQSPLVVKCESNNNSVNQCSFPKVIGNDKCVNSDGTTNYAITNSEIWVWNGCSICIEVASHN